MNKLLIYVIMILSLALFVQAVPYQPSSQYYIPLWTSAYCDALPQHVTGSWDLSSYESGLLGASMTKYCSQDVNGYFPNGCHFSVQCTDSVLGGEVGICEGSECINVNGGLIFTEGCPFLQVVDTSQYGGVYAGFTGLNALLDTGDIVVRTDSQPYGLWEYQGTGYVAAYPTCDLDALIQLDYLGDFPAQQGHFVSDHVLHVGYQYIHHFIIGQVQVQSPRAIVNHDGEAVYIQGAGGYYPTFDVNSEYFVDVRPQSFIQDASILCSPASEFCNDDGTAWQVNPEGRFCDQFVGVGNEYVQRTSTQMCKMTCDENSQSLQWIESTCITIDDNCPPERPFWNPNTNNCMAVPVSGVDYGQNYDTLIWIIIIGVVALGLVLYFTRRKGGKKRR